MRLALAFLIFSLSYHAQDSLYARKVIKTLTSKKYNGRGYVKKGVNKASDYIVKEISHFHAKPL